MLHLTLKNPYLKANWERRNLLYEATKNLDLRSLGLELTLDFRTDTSYIEYEPTVSTHRYSLKLKAPVCHTLLLWQFTKPIAEVNKKVDWTSSDFFLAEYRLDFTNSQTHDTVDVVLTLKSF
jgi:hypothetical protein